MSLVDFLKPYYRFQNCNISTTIFHVSDLKIENATGMVKFGMDAMGAVETDFHCAGMCGTSPFYTFSNVTRGPPY